VNIKRLSIAMLAGCALAMPLSQITMAQPALLELHEVDELKPWVGPLYPDTPAAKAHADAARALANSDNPIVRWQHRVWCETGYHNVNNLGTGQTADPLPDATKDLISPNGFYYRGYNDLISESGGVKFLDNAWYFGTLNLGAVVVQTEAGDLLLFDAFTTPQDTQTQLLDQMPAAGLDPARITHIFIGHQHGDHIGGINLIRDNHAPDAKVVAGQFDAEDIRALRSSIEGGTGPRPRGLPENATEEQIAEATAAQLYAVPETIDLEVPALDGTNIGLLTLDANGTEVVLTMNPGHTPGQISAIVPVKWQGEDHKLMVWSGNDQLEQAAMYARSTDFARIIAEQEGADVWFNTHPYQGALFGHLQRLNADPNYPNHLVMGADNVSRMLGIFADCQRAAAQRIEDGTWVSWE
jgi:glyoxylase-like metal-dependent hydrolase (beta-lactamase superfamily II)